MATGISRQKLGETGISASASVGMSARIRRFCVVSLAPRSSAFRGARTTQKSGIRRLEGWRDAPYGRIAHYTRTRRLSSNPQDGSTGL